MSLKNKDDKIFDDTTLSDVLKDIYNNSKDRKAQIDQTMSQFFKHIKGNKDVSFIGPVIKDLLHVSVQNDEQLVKMATIVQRIMTNNGSNENDGLLTQADKDALLQIARQSNEPLSKSLPADFGLVEEIMLNGKDPEELTDDLSVIGKKVKDDDEEQTD